ncbi:MAG: hypothetical protein LC649_04585 [Bacteroidales bacterium]|nr:hypothetical protein [Bacteroidales bacterium]
MERKPAIYTGKKICGVLPQAPILLLMILILPAGVAAQTIFEPHYTLKTPVTLNIISLEMTKTGTVINLSLENRIEGGYFCTDKNSFLVTPDGMRLKLTGTTGIPACPELHRFASVGEVLYFTLRFPPLPDNTAWFDLVEECGDNCFSVLGIATDPTLNLRMNECYRAVDSGDSKRAIALFEEVLPLLEKDNHALTGSVYLTLITLSEDNDPELAGKYRQKLASSSVPHKKLMTGGN